MIVNYERNGKVYSADVEKLPSASIAYLLQYGFAQSLQDSIAGSAKAVRAEYTEQADAANETVSEQDVLKAIAADIEGSLNKRVDSIVAGTVGHHAAQVRDPFASMCKRVTIEMLRKGFKAANIKWPKESEKVQELITTAYEKNKVVIDAEATKRLASQSDIEIELPTVA